VAAVLAELRAVDGAEALRQDYQACEGDWVRGIAGPCARGEREGAGLRRVEDAAYGLCWLELAHRLRLDLQRSLVAQLPPALFRPAAEGNGATHERVAGVALDARRDTAAAER